MAIGAALQLATQGAPIAGPVSVCPTAKTKAHAFLGQKKTPFSKLFRSLFSISCRVSATHLTASRPPQTS